MYTQKYRAYRSMLSDVVGCTCLSESMLARRPTFGFVGLKLGSGAYAKQCMLHLPTLERRGSGP